MEYPLSMGPNHIPVVQKRRHLEAKRSTTTVAKVQKLLKVEFIKECQYPEWFSNVVLEKELNETWRMCVDFTDLNKVCLKDSYPY